MGSPVFPAARQPLLLALADVIVPRAGDSPAASEIDLVPRLERWVERSPNVARIYAVAWKDMDAAVRAQVRFEAGRPDPQALHALCERWFREYTDAPRPSRAALVFEQLRWDVLTVYYASPAGRTFVGDPGRAPAPFSPVRADS